MTNEQLERAIEFLIQSQADLFARNKEMQATDERLQVKLDSLSETVRNLAVLGHDLVRVAEIHSRRLDGLEGILPH